MRTDKIRSAELLFDAIGEIDDRLIQEAQVAPARSAKKPRYSFKAIIALAATLTLVIGVLGAVAISKMIGSVLDRVTADLEEEEPIAPEENASLSQTLISAQESATVVSNVENIDFFDGSTRIVWRIEGEEEYRTVTLKSQNDAARLINAVEAQTQEITPEDTELPECEVWITLGDGRVISPYLKASAGNIGYAELFEYSPEIEPDEKLTKLIGDLISD